MMITHMRRVVAVVGVGLVLAIGSLTLVAQQAQPAQQAWPTVANRAVRPPQSWENDIKKFEAADKLTPVPQNGVVFIGSSSIVRWDVAKYFPELGPKAINRGFGGTVAADATYYADRIVIPYKPAIVVYYSGDNDVESPISAEDIASEFVKFEQKVHKALPNTKIVFISIKPSLRRWAFQDKMNKANAMVKSHVGMGRNMTYVDVVASMLGADGKPKPELFVEDGLHMTPAGYVVWTAALKPHLRDVGTKN
jgi:lysophospholipase L1-like esterase